MLGWVWDTGYWSSLATVLGSHSSGGTALTTAMIEFRVITILCLKRSLKQLELGRLPVRLFRKVGVLLGTNLHIQAEISLKAAISLERRREAEREESQAGSAVAEGGFSSVTPNKI